MKPLVVAIIASHLIVLSYETCRAQSVEAVPLPQKVVQTVMEFWKDEDLRRYMESTCKTMDGQGNWKGFQVNQCTYQTHDNHKATVIMLNPPREILVKWVVASCAMKYGIDDERLLAVCSGDLLRWIFFQSGSQFVIAGLVDEGGAYSFRDGIAVMLKLGSLSWIHEVTAEYQKASLNANYPVAHYGNRARIAGVSREWFAAFEKQYLKQSPTDSSEENFLPIIRRAYQDACPRANDKTLPETVGKYRNDLIAAYHFR